MKILHTSDIHLIGLNDNRWIALNKIIDLANKENVDLLVISGDLFDKNSNAELLKNEIRRVFTGNSFKIALIPGNHDYKAFTPGVFFGKDVIYKNNMYSPAFSFKDIDVWEMPFEPIGETEVLRRLKRVSKVINRKKVNILLYHGELLDAFYSGGDYGEEGESNYMPVRLSYFENLGFQYILAGHFHRSFEIKNPGNGVYFVYSGSPVSITKREIGKRVVNLFEVGAAPEEYELNTSYYELKEIVLNPSDSKDPFSIIIEEIKKSNPDSRLILKIRGYIDSSRTGYDEEEFYKRIDDIMPENIEEKVIEVNDISSIINDELFREFYGEIEGMSVENKDKEEIIELVMNAFIRLR